MKSIVRTWGNQMRAHTFETKHQPHILPFLLSIYIINEMSIDYKLLIFRPQINHDLVNFMLI